MSKIPYDKCLMKISDQYVKFRVNGLFFCYKLSYMFSSEVFVYVKISSIDFIEQYENSGNLFFVIKKE